MKLNKRFAIPMLVLAGFALACGLRAIIAVRADTRTEHERKTIESESDRPGKVPVS